MALFAAEGGGDFAGFEGFQELFLGVFGGAFPGKAFDCVVGDQIYFGVEFTGEGGKGFDLVEGIVHTGDEDIFEGNHPSLFLLVIFARGGEVLEGEFFVNRHDLAADFIRRAMEGNGEAELEGFVGEFADLRDEAAGGNGDFACSDVATPGGVEDGEGLEEAVVVGEGLTHAHDDEVVDEAIGSCRTGRTARRGATRNSRVGCATHRIAFDGEDLLDDFVRLEIAFPAFEAAGTEAAAIGAADLRGDAQGVTIAGFAIERRVGRNEDAFDERMVSEPPEEFLCGIAGALPGDELQSFECVMLPQLIAQAARQIGHSVPIRDAPAIKPVQELVEPVGREIPFGKARRQFVACLGSDVR